ncbi:acyl-CoA synthetase [Sorangium sp. So ce1151]|uniref:SLOG cluster 4 domain-containing protein n=1 Tax=Sorangium sp. So ce1151 TaxID=3133332 RepID=UPI003F612FE8
MRRPILAVIGDAGVAPDSPTYTSAFELGRLAVDAGFRVMTGGLGGVMEASSRGAHASERYREGDTIGILPHFDPGEANEWVDIVLATGLDHARNGLVANADAVVAIGGGAGTLCEVTFAWMYRRLIVAIAAPGWSAELGGRRLDHRVRYPGVADDQIFAAEDARHAIAIVLERLPDYGARHTGFRRRRREAD